MFKRLFALWMLIRHDLRRLWRALQHPRSPAWLKWAAAALLLYLLSPIDLIPEALLGLGIIDDLVLIPTVLHWLLNQLPRDVQADIDRSERPVDPR